MRPATWVDDCAPERIADPEVAMQDVRQAHAWVTQELAAAEPGSIRLYVLTQERGRLAEIAWRLKRASHVSAVRPWQERRANYLERKGATV